MALTVTPSKAVSALRQEAEHLSAPLPALLVEADRIAQSVAQGIHGRRRVGIGETFWEYRHHRPEDPASAIDWRQSAKSDHLYVRENEWEAAESVWLWCDMSASMTYRSRFASVTKVQRAAVLCLATAILLLRGGERVALLGAGRAAAGGRLALRQFTADIAERLASGRRSPENSLPPTLPLPRFSQLVLVGDFLCPPETLADRLKHYAQLGVSGHMLQILDPAEEDLPFDGRTRFEGIEDTLELTVGRAETLRQPYRQRLLAHQQALRDLARRFGWTFSLHRTDRAAGTALMALYSALAHESVGGSPPNRGTPAPC